MADTDTDDARPRHQAFTRNQRAALRRHAVQIAAQLPEDTQQALYVLDEVRTLVNEFLARDADDAPPCPIRLVAMSQDD